MRTPEERDAYLEAVLVGGRERVDIVICDYDPQWPARFGAVRDRVQQALGSNALLIEHIGSTAVPGLAAKPIIDVVVTVPDVEREAEYVAPLEAAGFELRVREAEHRMLRTPARDVHVHVYGPGHPEVQACLDLRDRLRDSAEDRDLYASTKRELASREWSDMNDYADAKTDVIASILSRRRRA